MKRILLALIISASCSLSYAQSWQDTVSMIEKIFERVKPGNPGTQLSISRNGQIIFSKSWGIADLEHKVPLTNESIIEAGSVSKQFTAAAILLLEQQGKLSLNDDVRKHVPEIPDYGVTITLRHMMQHVSGIKDWGSIAAISGWPRSTKTYNNEDALYIISKQKTLNNKPGAEYIYSNSNYNLFAIIVQRVSGKSLAAFTKEYIFEPAGMNHTEWRDNYKKIVPNRAIAYTKENNVYYTEMPNEFVYGNGGLLTTTEDLLIWNNYYLNGKLGSPSLLPKQLEQHPFNNGAMNRYAAGLQIDTIRGWKSINHSGSTAGYRANLEFFPALNLSIAILCNTTDFDQGPNVSSQVRNIFLKDISVNQNNASPTPFTISQKLLESYQGWYWSMDQGMAVRLFMRDGKLANSRGGDLIPLSENSFQLGPNQLVVNVGKTKKLLLKAPFGDIHFEAVDSANLDDKTKLEYVGEYYSEEADVTYKMLMKKERLIMYHEPGSEFLFIPTYKDGFNSAVGAIHFVRDNKNIVTGFKVYQGRARNVVFKKIK